MIINTSNGNFLCTYSQVEIYRSLCDYIKRFFDITTKEGA